MTSSTHGLVSKFAFLRLRSSFARFASARQRSLVLARGERSGRNPHHIFNNINSETMMYVDRLKKLQKFTVLRFVD